MIPRIPKLAKSFERHLMTLLDVMFRRGKAKGNLLNSSATVRRYWFLLQDIGLGAIMWIDSRSQGSEDRIRLLPCGRKKRGFHRARVLQFWVCNGCLIPSFDQILRRPEIGARHFGSLPNTACFLG